MNELCGDSMQKKMVASKFDDIYRILLWMMEDNWASKSITIQLSKYVKSVPTVSDNPRIVLVLQMRFKIFKKRAFSHMMISPATSMLNDWWHEFKWGFTWLHIMEDVIVITCSFSLLLMIILRWSPTHIEDMKWYDKKFPSI